jgi:hypothetical protein
MKTKHFDDVRPKLWAGTLFLVPSLRPFLSRLLLRLAVSSVRPGVDLACLSDDFLDCPSDGDYTVLGGSLQSGLYADLLIEFALGHYELSREPGDARVIAALLDNGASLEKCQLFAAQTGDNVIARECEKRRNLFTVIRLGMALACVSLPLVVAVFVNRI